MCTTEQWGIRHDYDIQPNERSIQETSPSHSVRDWGYELFDVVISSSKPCMKLRKSEERSLVRLVLQVDPKMEIGYSELELWRDELGTVTSGK